MCEMNECAEEKKERNKERIEGVRECESGGEVRVKMAGGNGGGGVRVVGEWSAGQGRRRLALHFTCCP